MTGFQIAALLLLPFLLWGMWWGMTDSECRSVVDHNPCPPPLRLDIYRPDAIDRLGDVKDRVRLLTVHVLRLEQEVARLGAQGEKNGS